MRDRVLLELLTSTGMRLGEALALTKDDLIDRGREDRFVRVQHRQRGGGAKGDSGREVPVRPALYTALDRLAGSRRDSLSDRIFQTDRKRNGEHAALQPRTVENMVKVTADRAGIRKRVHPHLLRHSFATNFMRKTGNPIALQRILGHHDLSMISGTYAHPSSGDLYASMIDYLRAE